MNGKHSIHIGNDEKELYHIFKDLERYGRTTFSYPDPKKQQSIARTIGIRVSPLAKQDLMIPPLSSTNKFRMTGIQLPTNVKIKESKEGNGSRFYFSFKKQGV